MKPVAFKTWLATLTLLLITTIQNSRGNDFSNPVLSRTPTEELLKVANQMIADPNFVLSLRPTYGECRKIAFDQSSALKIWYYSIEFYDVVKAKSHLPLKTSPDSADVIPVLDNFSKLKPIQSNLAETYRKGNAWFTINFKKSDQQVAAFTGFAKVNGRWIFVPRFYEAFSAEKVPTASLTVLKMLESNMNNDLYDFCSPRLTEQMDRKKAADFFATLGFTKVKKAYPKSRGQLQVHDRRMVQQGMNVDFVNGQSGAVNMIFDVNEKGDVCLAWIAIQSRLGVNITFSLSPLPSRCRKLAVNVLGKVTKALETEDFAKLHSESAKPLTDRFDVEQLKAAFPKGNKVLAQVPLLDVATLKLANPPSLGKYDAFRSANMNFRPENERPPMGPLVIRAVIATKDGSQKIGATFEFHFEEKTWKPSGYTFYPLKK